MPIEPKLRPCPFCGSDKTKLHGPDERGDYYSVLCDDCNAEGPPGEDGLYASELWNNKSDSHCVLVLSRVEIFAAVVVPILLGAWFWGMFLRLTNQ